MTQDKLEKVEKEIKRILEESPLDFEVMHGELAQKRLLEMMPDADDAVRIAALAHDIDRGVYKITETYNLKDYGNIDEFKREHAIRSSQIIENILNKEGFDSAFVEKVVRIVRNHEVGGDAETNAVMDADSISYFDYNIYEYYKKNGPERLKNKVMFMVSRVSPKGLQIIKNIKFKDEVIGAIVKEVLDKLVEGKTDETEK